MLKFGNKEFRNLQEQVLKNMRDIQNIMQGTTVLAEFGIKVIGQVDTSAELPDPATYEGEYGDAYIVGTEEPYEYYIFTRAFEGQEEPSWFDLGIFPVPGPQGETGPQGPVGPQGQTGNPGTDGAPAGFGTITATAQTLVPGSSATATVVASGPDTEKSFAFTFGIPRGEDGSLGGVWGDITGNIQDQTDLVNALQAKQDTLVSGTNIKTISGNSILGGGDVKVSQLQATATIVIDALTNLNRRIISNYEATLDTSTSYTYYVITRGGNQLTEEQARDYMEYMTGSRFLPVYDYETPENSIFIFANGSLWKPQFDNEGLKLYALPNPYASKGDLTNYVNLGSDQTISGKKTFSSGKLVATDIYAPNVGVDTTYRAFNLYGGITAGNTISPSINARKQYGTVYGYDLGEQNLRWRDLYLYRSLRDGKNANYGLILPDTTSFTADKTIATTDEIPTATSDLTNDSGFITSSALTNYVDLTSSQEISGAKTFTTAVLLKNNVSLKLGNSYSNGYQLANDGSGGLLFKNNYNVAKYHFTDNNFYPDVSGVGNLGTSSKAWGDLYLSRNLSDGTNSISVANIANKNNFITLTQAEYDALATKDPDTYYFIEEE